MLNFGGVIETIYSIQLVITTKFHVFTQSHEFKKTGLNDNLFTRRFWVICGSLWPQSIILSHLHWEILGLVAPGSMNEIESRLTRAICISRFTTGRLCYASVFQKCFNACLCSEHRISLIVKTLAVLQVQLHISQVQDSLFVPV